MRYYPLEKDPAFYIESVNEWGKYETCHDLANTIERRQQNICGTNVCARIYHPEKEKTSKRKGKKKKKKGKGKKQAIVRQKHYDSPEPVFIRYWNDLQGKKIKDIKEEHLNWPDWQKTRLRKRYLPCHIRPTFIKICQGRPFPLPYALIPINIATVRAIIKQDKIAAKLAKKLAKEAKAAAKLAAIIAKAKGKKV